MTPNERVNIPLNSRELAKTQKYREALDRGGIKIAPFAVSLYGAFGSRAAGIIEQLAVRIARFNDLDVSVTTKVIRTRLSITLKEGVVQSLLAHLGLK